MILQQPIDVEQARKLLTDGKSDELADFVSNRTKRKFAAMLVLDKAGKVGFEFTQKKVPTPREKTAKKKAAES